MALTYRYDRNHIYSSSWGPSDDARTIEGPGKLTSKALANGVVKGRNGLGSIYVFASGNGLNFIDNCNFDGYANSIYTVTIGAATHNGQWPYYGEKCAAQLAAAYSGDGRVNVVRAV